MKYRGAIYQTEGRGVAFQGQVGAGEGYFMILCSIRNEDGVDMELSAYVMRRLRQWVWDNIALEDGYRELPVELEQIEKELKVHGSLRKQRGRSGDLGWEYLSLLLCRDSYGLLAVRGKGQAWVTNRSMGHRVKEKLLPEGPTDCMLLELQGQIGILLTASPVSEDNPWPKQLDPEGIPTREQLSCRVKELAVYGLENNWGIGYVIGSEGCDCKGTRR